MSISANIICFNEIEMLPILFEFLESIKELDEIVFIDSFSTDGSFEFAKDFKTSKKLILEQREFKSFSDQRNYCMSRSSSDWIFYIDCDETYSQDINILFSSLDSYSDIIAVRIPTLVSVYDFKTVIDTTNLDPHIRLWRRGSASFERDAHEHLVDKSGRILHGANGTDIINTLSIEKYKNIFMLHHQLLKSSKCLSEKGERWDSLGMIKKSSEMGIPISKNSWVDWKAHREYKTKMLDDSLMNNTIRKRS